MRKTTVVSVVVLLLLAASAPRALAQGTYTQIDVPGATATFVEGIDTAGDVVGYYADSSSTYHGFLLSSGTYTTIDPPGSTHTIAVGINDEGQIVGSATTGSYLYDVATQTFTRINFHESSTSTSTYGINNAGTIVGLIQNTITGHNYGFELSAAKYTKVALPQPYSYLSSINNSGIAIGDASNGQVTKPFLYSQGKITKLNVPGITPLYASGVNDNGAIAGSYLTPSASLVGFVYQNGVVGQIAFPGSNITYANSINNAGEVVGFFSGSDNNFHGFLWTPPAGAAKK
ncbi:MAG: hypothetical protein LAN83_12605 [Acidobacteriia bacterium]|nr:hypothetical protein [Terriglobia bacterium]